MLKPEASSWAERSSPALTLNVFPGPACSAQLKAALTGIQSSAVLQPLLSLWNSYSLCVLSEKPSTHSSASCLSPVFLAVVQHLQNLTPNLLIVLTSHCIKCKEYSLETIQCPFSLSSCPSETSHSCWHCPPAKPQLGEEFQFAFFKEKNIKKKRNKPHH